MRKYTRRYSGKYSEFDSRAEYDYKSKVGFLAPHYYKIIKRYFYQYAGKGCTRYERHMDPDPVIRDMAFLLDMFYDVIVIPKSLDLQHFINENKEIFSGVLQSLAIVMKNHLERKDTDKKGAIQTPAGNFELIISSYFLQRARSHRQANRDFELMIALYRCIERIVCKDSFRSKEPT